MGMKLSPARSSPTPEQPERARAHLERGVKLVASRVIFFRFCGWIDALPGGAGRSPTGCGARRIPVDVVLSILRASSGDRWGVARSVERLTSLAAKRSARLAWEG